jgi:hypothetical protein
MSQGTRSVGRPTPAGAGGAPSARPQPEQKRAPGVKADPQEGQKPEDEVIAAI